MSQDTNFKADPKAFDKTSQSNKPNPNVVSHAAVAEPQPFKDSGKDIAQVNPPIQSIHPTSAKQGLNTDNNKPAKPEFKIIDRANRYLNHDGVLQDFKYPFNELDVDQGIFIPLPENITTDKLMATLHQQINIYIKQTSECEKDEKGDDVWESVVIQTKKRLDDGVIQLDSYGNPIVGANQTNRPKLIHSSNFVVKAVVKGDEISKGNKASSDGVLVVRVA